MHIYSPSVTTIFICGAILVCGPLLYVTWAGLAPWRVSLRRGPRQVINSNESVFHPDLVSTSWVIDTLPRQALSVKMTGIEHRFLVGSVKKRTRTTTLRTVEREAWSDWLPVRGPAVSLNEEDTPEKWHAVKKATGLAGISLHEQDPPLEVEGSNILNVFSGPETVAPKPIDNGDSPMQLERLIVPAMGGEAADLDPKSVREGDAPSGLDLVSMLNDVNKSAAALAVIACAITGSLAQLLHIYGATTALCDLSKTAKTLEVTCYHVKTRAMDTVNTFDNLSGPEWTRLGFCKKILRLLAGGKWELMVLGQDLKRLDSQVLNLIPRKVWLKVKHLQHEKMLRKHCDEISRTTDALNMCLKNFTPNPSPRLAAFDSPIHVSHSGGYTSDSALNNVSDLSIYQ
jgi:hypothetical protein